MQNDWQSDFFKKHCRALEKKLHKNPTIGPKKHAKKPFKLIKYIGHSWLSIFLSAKLKIYSFSKPCACS